jgi:hypothetical protein
MGMVASMQMLQLADHGIISYFEKEIPFYFYLAVPFLSLIILGIVLWKNRDR